MSSRAQLIEGLVEDLEPARGFRPPGTLALLWLGGSWAFVVAATLASAPLRPGALAQLAGSPHFALETLVGLSAGVVAICAGLSLGFPARGAVRRWSAAAGFLLALWVAAHVLALWVPALEPSMLGKRSGCIFEVLLYGSPPLVAGLLLLRRFATFNRYLAGALVGAAAGAIPALLMQVACMYVPEHILMFHLAPNAILAVVGALLGPFILKRI